MAIVSQPLQTSEWTFPTITNTCEVRVAGRKRGLEEDYEGGKQRRASVLGSNKKAKTMESIENVSNASGAFNTSDTSAPPEFFAGDRKFEPLCEDTTPTQIILEENVPSPEPVDVQRVISILLHALQSNNDQDANKRKNESLASRYQPRFTSPLSGSPARVPFVRKEVGGSCRGHVDPGLQKWVLCRNHYVDICSYHPSHRSGEWVEALHEMGWENLHPTYMSQSQQTFETLTMFSTSCDDWIDIDRSHEGQNSNATAETGIVFDQNLEGIHEDVWDLGVDSAPRSRITV